MANTTFLGNEYIIYIDTVTAKTAARGTVTNYKGIACLTSNGFSGSSDAISTTNKCTGRWNDSDPSTSSWEISGEGHAISDAATTQANYQAIAQLWVSGTKFWAKMANPANNVVREGLVWISSYSETAGNNEPYSFSVTFTGTKEPIIIA